MGCGKGRPADRAEVLSVAGFYVPLSGVHDREEQAMKEGTEAMAPLPSGDPRMKAWKEYQATARYKNTRRWARVEQHVDGSLWAAFVEGWSAANEAKETP